jgi:hypothetical protein
VSRRHNTTKAVRNASPIFLSGKNCCICKKSLAASEPGRDALSLASKDWVCTTCYSDTEKFKNFWKSQAVLRPVEKSDEDPLFGF